MLLPNKITSFSESVFSYFPVVLKALQQGPRTASSLFKDCCKHENNLLQFIQALICLYALNKIVFDENEVELKYVDRN